MRGQVFDSFRLFEDGYIAFSFPESVSSDENQCLLNIEEPGQAIYGWWTNLQKSTAASQISTFLQGEDRFVVEFKEMTAPLGAAQYQVSFQIVLYRNGDIRLNYLNAPAFQGKPAHATIGVEAKDALFGFQVACSTDTQVIGTLPQSGQSYLIKAEYLF